MRPPNLLFIFTDEQRIDTFAAYGNTQIEMPNLNRLAASSTVFERAYCTQPICTPSRSSLMSGLYPHTTGCIGNNAALPADVRCLPEMIAEGDYATGYYGKWHLGDEIFPQHGFDEWYSIEDEYIAWYSEGRDREARSAYHQFLIENRLQPDKEEIFSRGYAARLPEDLGKPAFLGRGAADFIHRHRDQPFMLVVNFLEPHMPFFGPRDDQYDPAQIPLPANFHNPPTEEQHLRYRLIREAYIDQGHSGLPLTNEAEWRRMIANYWGLNSLVDTHTGVILDALEAAGVADDTIIVFTSDHGDMMGSHQMLAKTVMFEESVRIPLLIRLPGQTAAARISKPVSQIDLVPTLLDLMGQPVPDHLAGKSRRAELEGGSTGEADDVFIQMNSTESGILETYEKREMPEAMTRLATRESLEAAVRDPLRTIITPDGWKLTVSCELGQHELYNLNDDPLETTNLARRPEMAERVRELAGRIRDWQIAYDDIVAPVGL